MTLFLAGNRTWVLRGPPDVQGGCHFRGSVIPFGGCAGSPGPGFLGGYDLLLIVATAG